jgi:hypothetical protein
MQFSQEELLFMIHALKDVECCAGTFIGNVEAGILFQDEPSCDLDVLVKKLEQMPFEKIEELHRKIKQFWNYSGYYIIDVIARIKEVGLSD